mgnify:FL=1
MASAISAHVRSVLFNRHQHARPHVTGWRAVGLGTRKKKSRNRSPLTPNALPGVPYPWSPDGTDQPSVISELASRVVAAAFFGDGDGDARVFVGIAGCPGSGKSTLAKQVAAKVNTAAGDDVCVIFPMDGFHYYMRDLKGNKDVFPDAELAVKRRGAPFTFDAKAFVDKVRVAKTDGATINIPVPEFDHETHDPEEGKITIKPTHKIVLVEGNYLLLPDSPWSALVGEELLDETWFVDTSVDDAMSRIEKRHVAVGRTPEVAKTRADGNDRPNAELVVKHKERADVFVPSYDM